MVPECVERVVAWSQKVEEDLAKQGYFICCGPDGCYTIPEPHSSSGPHTLWPDPVAVFRRMIELFRS